MSILFLAATFATVGVVLMAISQFVPPANPPVPWGLWPPRLAWFCWAIAALLWWSTFLAHA